MSCHVVACVWWEAAAASSKFVAVNRLRRSRNTPTIIRKKLHCTNDRMWCYFHAFSTRLFSSLLSCYTSHTSLLLFALAWTSLLLARLSDTSYKKLYCKIYFLYVRPLAHTRALSHLNLFFIFYFVYIFSPLFSLSPTHDGFFFCVDFFIKNNYKFPHFAFSRLSCVCT